MKFVVVDKLPDIERSHYKPEYNKIREGLDVFVKMGVECVRVDVHYDEYSNAESLYSVLRKACNNYKDLPVKPFIRNGAVYLVRRDM